MLTGKTMLVTGSSRGIGAAIARCAWQNGAKVILHGKSGSRALTELCAELSATCLVFDVSDMEAVQREIGYVNGPIDILVNNAGVNLSKTFEELWEDPASLYLMMDVNFYGVWNVCSAVVPRMFERGNSAIVNIASIKGLPGVEGKPGYAAPKAAVIQLTRNMATAFAAKGVRVNAVAPGFTLTEMTQKSLDQEQALGKTTLRDQIAKIPMRRMATPEEIAEAVVFLASDKASYITGQCLVVDGGLSIV